MSRDDQIVEWGLAALEAGAVSFTELFDQCIDETPLAEVAAEDNDNPFGLLIFLLE